MLTVKDVAREWNVSPGVIYKLVEEGKLRCHRIGTAIRFAREQLKHYLDSSSKFDENPKQSFSHLDL